MYYTLGVARGETDFCSVVKAPPTHATTLEEAQLLMNCHPLASSSGDSATASATAAAPSPSPGGGGGGSDIAAAVYENNNTIPTEYGMHQHQAGDISGGE